MSDAKKIIQVAHGCSFMNLEIIAKGTHDDVVRIEHGDGKLLSLVSLFANGWVVLSGERQSTSHE